MRIAELEARISVAVAVQIDVESFAVFRDDGLLRGLNEALEILPRLFGQRMAGRTFDDLTVAIDFATRDAADDHMRVLASARDKLVVDGAGEFLRISVEREGSFRAVRKFRGLIAAAMCGRQYEGQAAGDILDVLITTEIGLAWFRRLGGTQDDGGRQQADAEEAGHTVSKANPRGGSSGRNSAGGTAGQQGADRGFFRHGIRCTRRANSVLQDEA